MWVYQKILYLFIWKNKIIIMIRMMEMNKGIKMFMACDIILDGKDAQTTHFIELLKNLKIEAASIICFAPKPKNIKYNQKIMYIPSLINGKVIWYILYQLPLLFYLVYYCIKSKPDIIYARYSAYALSPLIVSKFFRVPYVVEINGLIIDEMKMNNKLEVYTKIVKLSEKLTYKHVEKIVAVTQGIKEGIKEAYNVPDEKIVVIENGANTDLFEPEYQKEAKSKLKLDSKKNYVCFVGNLAPWQGVEYLIQSAPLVLKEMPNTKFLIIGDGKIKKELIELAAKTNISNNFIFIGAVPYEEVPKYINASDVCVAPKKPLKSGYSPLKLYEYMACGKSVIASRVGGFEILEKNKAGILVEPENQNELAKAIIKLLKDKKLREKMGKNGREYVIKNHSWKSVAKRVEEVCKNMIK